MEGLLECGSFGIELGMYEYLAVLPPRYSDSCSRSVGWNNSGSLRTKATSGHKRQRSPEVNLRPCIFPRLFPEFMHDFFSPCKKKKKSIRVTQVLKRSKNKCYLVVRSCAAKQANGFLVTLVTQLISIIHFPVDSELKHKLLVQKNYLRLSSNTYQVLNNIFSTKLFDFGDHTQRKYIEKTVQPSKGANKHE